MSNWGRLPKDIRLILRQQEWDKPRRWREWLSGDRQFPLTLSLKVPSGKQALNDMAHFQAYVQAWEHCALPAKIMWEARQYREFNIAEQKLPTHLTLSSKEELLEWLGEKAIAQNQHWHDLMQPLLDYDKNLYPALVYQLGKLEKLSIQDTQLLAKALPQLQADMGQGCYLRALPLQGVDTKFIETHSILLTTLLNVLHHDAIQQGDLLAWLNCRPIPKNWLWLRPLCPQTQAALGGLSLLQLTVETLRAQPLPAKHILIIENTATGYALPHLANTIAVFGGGANLAWMQAAWLADKDLIYWGDLDTWGLKYLSDARAQQAHVQAIMMDKTTLLAHQSLMVKEEKPCETLPPNLNMEEQQLFVDLRNAVYENSRLEQERIAADYVLAKLQTID
jgi:hypothetical protein